MLFKGFVGFFSFLTTSRLPFMRRNFFPGGKELIGLYFLMIEMGN